MKSFPEIPQEYVKLSLDRMYVKSSPIMQKERQSEVPRHIVPGDKVNSFFLVGEGEVIPNISNEQNHL